MDFSRDLIISIDFSPSKPRNLGEDVSIRLSPATSLSLSLSRALSLSLSLTHTIFLFDRFDVYESAFYGCSTKIPPGLGSFCLIFCSRTDYWKASCFASQCIYPV
jgi:hypothetical protein